MLVRIGVPLVSVAVLALTTALACGSGGTEWDSMRKAAPAGPGLHDPTAGLGELVVPPDRARVAVVVSIHDKEVAKAAARAGEELDGLATAVSEVPGCDALPRDYQAPTWNDYEDAWVASVWADVDIDLAGASDVPARMARIDACRAALIARAAVAPPADAKRQLVMGSVVLHVDQPEAHLPALLARRSEQLMALAGAGGQLFPEDQRCVPKGVAVGGAALSGITLVLVEECRMVIPQGAEG